jgi:23S rRNA (cytidine1920-2'-O)/16S rRNA (cytidine1409-2'-O)-methyltransferase
MNKNEKVVKQRLDVLLAELGLYPSREKAKAHILAGEVTINGQVRTGAGEKVRIDSAIEIKGADKFVSRGGDKLAGALDSFALDVAGLRALDVGASTGGFTDCLLQRGATHVTAVDVGYGQIALSLRGDPRVTVIERTNARNIQPSQFDGKFDLATVDVSFISLEKILPALAGLLSTGGRILALVKPQFEAGPEKVRRGGVVKDPAVHVEVLQNVFRSSMKNKLVPIACAISPITGPAGNIEFFMLMRRAEGPAENEITLAESDILEIVAAAHRQFQK